MERCHANAAALDSFSPVCNPNIISDAKVGVHLLAGAARAAYQTVLVNSPPPELKARLDTLLFDLDVMEARALGAPTPAYASIATAAAVGVVAAIAFALGRRLGR